MSFLPAISAGASILGSLGGLFGGGSDQPEAPPPGYRPAYSAPADYAIYNKNMNLDQFNTAGQTLPYASSTFQNLYNNPYAQQFQQGANTAAGIGWGTGLGQVQGGQSLIGAGMGALPFAQDILQTGFDPQNALYDRNLQRTTDTTRAGLAARGLGMSPYGAGVENEALKNFNIDWENAQLGRQNTAAQGAGYLLNSGGNAINLGQNVGTLGLQTLNNAAMLPYSTANTIGGNQNAALGQYGSFGQQASAIPQQQIANFLQYLGIGNQAAGVANQGYANQLTANNQQFNQQQKLGSNLGSGLSGLGDWFKNSGFSFG